MKKILISFYIFLCVAGCGISGNKVKVYSGEKYVGYQKNGIRVYFSTEFLHGFVDGVDVDVYSQNFYETIGELFRTGLLTGKMFLEEMGYSGQEVVNLSGSDLAQFDNEESVYNSIMQFKGKVIKILYYEEKRKDEPGKEFELWVTPSIYETGWGSFHKFKVDLLIAENGDCDLLNFKYLGMEL